MNCFRRTASLAVVIGLVGCLGGADGTESTAGGLRDSQEADQLSGPLEAGPSEAQIDWASEAQACDPSFEGELEAWVASEEKGETTDEPMLDPACGGEEAQLAAGCFQRAWSWMNWRERAACVAVGLPICWTIFCSGVI